MKRVGPDDRAGDVDVGCDVGCDSSGTLGALMRRAVRGRVAGTGPAAAVGVGRRRRTDRCSRRWVWRFTWRAAMRRAMAAAGGESTARGFAGVGAGPVEAILGRRLAVRLEVRRQDWCRSRWRCSSLARMPARERHREGRRRRTDAVPLRLLRALCRPLERTPARVARAVLRTVAGRRRPLRSPARVLQWRDTVREWEARRDARFRSVLWVLGLGLLLTPLMGTPIWFPPDASPWGCCTRCSAHWSIADRT